MAITLPALLPVDDIGPVLFKSNKRYKRLSVRVSPFEGVQVLLPPGFSITAAKSFVEEKREWLKKSIKKIEERERGYTRFDENTRFRTNSFALLIQKENRHDVRLLLKDGFLRVYYPGHLPVFNTTIQEAIRYGIEEAMRREAKRVLPALTSSLARLHGFKYKGVFIKNLKTRWGSCSAENNINLNLHLMRLPDHLTNYVVLHELCHTVEKNHGTAFWRLLDRFTGGKAKILARDMKQHRTTIY